MFSSTTGKEQHIWDFRRLREKLTLNALSIGRILTCHSDVAGQRQLQTAAQSEPVDGRDRRHGQIS